MKKLFLSLVAMVIATVSMAQTSLLATLSHDGTISTFYGSTALKQALEKADNGDAITLSAGQFLAADITKAITLRGAGMRVRNDSVMTHEMTVIEGTFSVNIAEETEKRLIMEGLYISNAMTNKGTIRNAMFMKTRFNSVLAGEGSKIINSTFIHCRVANGINILNNSNVSMINSIIWNPSNIGTTASSFELENCMICYNDTPWSGSVIGSYYKNCLILQTASGGDYSSMSLSYCIPSSCVAFNCVGSTGSGESHLYNDIFYYMGAKNTSNKNAAYYYDVLKSGGMSYYMSHDDANMYELTDEAKATYLGLDGTQIGIYGGNLPYEEDPTTPQITKCNVAAKSTADGKLSVDIEVKATEY